MASTPSGPVFQLTIWDYAVPPGSFVGSAVVGHVHQQTISAPGVIPDCVSSSDPTWN
jgi:hypothetical protein